MISPMSETVTASGMKDTTDYADLMRQALAAADSHSTWTTYPGTD